MGVYRHCFVTNAQELIETPNTAEFTRFLSVAVVAAILGISRPSVLTLVRDGELPGIWVGHRVRIPAAGLETFLIAQGLKPSAIYRGTGQTATASPSPATITNASRTADAGAITR
ncbi:helix-turn-helix domain-containing protein [Methanoculleus sp. Afa-1]|uniref:Helix-turn-helix domain-containing protein n=1 Tax=Methanoculleus formosensis TaxID=2590886 RepID=A0A9E4ZMA0_9EURY|nr:helix-turn-helix domain-containing protein [Methanoculleus sp. Afa-1]